MAERIQRRRTRGWRSGPRLPHFRDAEDFDAADVAKGEKVPRCRVCGRPSQPHNRLISGTWTSGAFRMPLVLCEQEIPPPDPRSGDPLQAA